MSLVIVNDYYNFVVEVLESLESIEVVVPIDPAVRE
jgi:hypothetical protein